jgi:hypothetical protein
MASLSVAGSLMAVPASAQSVSSVKRVEVLGKRNPVEIEIEATTPLAAKVQVLTGPDRLVVDLPNTLPGAQLHDQILNRGEVKSVRVGLFSAKPPVTRVVFDLRTPQSYQIFPAGRTVIIKLGSADAKAPLLTPASSVAKLVNTKFPLQAAPVAAPPPPLAVSFSQGKLTIHCNKASLSEVLFAIHQRTGAEIAIPAGAEQETVVAELGPASAPEVLSNLLNGSRFNFLILSSATDPAILDKVILSARPEGPAPAVAKPLPQVSQQPEEDTESDVSSRTAPNAPAPHPNPGFDANPADRQTPPNLEGRAPSENDSN